MFMGEALGLIEHQASQGQKECTWWKLWACLNTQAPRGMGGGYCVFTWATKAWLLAYYDRQGQR